MKTYNLRFFVSTDNPSVCINTGTRQIIRRHGNLLSTLPYIYPVVLLRNLRQDGGRVSGCVTKEGEEGARVV